MRIKFHGPLDRVTGSCTELHDPVAGHHLLVDCGMWQGEGASPEVNLEPFPFNPADIQSVLLTHAHLDHCGRLPLLVKRGFTGTIYCTAETAELAKLNLFDSAKHGNCGFSKADVSALKFHEPSQAAFNNLCPIGPDLFVRFDRTGHILGATSIMLFWGSRTHQRSIVFSGDLGPHAEGEGGGLLRHRMAPAPHHYAVVESTYGDRVREPGSCSLETRLERLEKALTETVIERDDVVILPTFALGRTQEVLLDLHILYSRNPERFRHVPVYFDAGLAGLVNGITAKAIGRMVSTPRGKVRPAWLGKDLMSHLGLNPKDAADERLLIDCIQEMLNPKHAPKEVRRGPLKNWQRVHGMWPKDADRASVQGPAIVVTGGGMCEGGPVLEWLKAHLPNPNTTLLTTGYCSPETLAGRLVQLAAHTAEDRARLARGVLHEKLGDIGPVRAGVGTLNGYSAHADQAGLLHWLFEPMNYAGHTIKHRTVFIQHGNARARDGLAAAIALRAATESASVAVELPKPDSAWFDLNLGTWDDAHLSEVEVLKRRLAAFERQGSGR